LKELVFGCRVDFADQKLVTNFAKKWHPRIRITRVNRSMMDVPLLEETLP